MTAASDEAGQRRFDLVVIGAGPGGYVAAIRAAQLGLSVAIVEREHLGGICLNWGCIPTKALLRSAEVLSLMRHAADFGLTAENFGADVAKVVARSRGVARQLNQGVGHLLKKNRVTVLTGSATLDGPGRVLVTGDSKSESIAAAHIILATGARARDLPGLPADGQRVWTYRHAMVPEAIPERLLVLGSGAIGIEFASFFNDMGADVTVVELQDRIVPVEDADVSAFLAKSLTRQGITIRTGAKVGTMTADADGVTATITGADGKDAQERFSHVIVAIGIVPNTEGLGLEEAGVATDRGHVVIDALCRTGVPGIWAIGDITGAPWLAHKASHEGVIAAEAIATALGRADLHPHALDATRIPGCTYCHPQVASVGLTEQRARDAGHQVRTGTFPLIGNGKAIALGDPEGFVKTVFDADTGELLGAHMVGPEVTELIQGYTIGRTLEATEAELVATVFPHPTLSEAMHESVLAAHGRAIHI